DHPKSTGAWHLIDSRDDNGSSVRCYLPHPRQPVSPHVSRRVQELEHIHVTAEESDPGRRPRTFSLEQGGDLSLRGDFQHACVAGVGHIDNTLGVNREPTEIRMLIHCWNRWRVGGRTDRGHGRDPAPVSDSPDCAVLGVIQRTIGTSDNSADVRELLSLYGLGKRGKDRLRAGRSHTHEPQITWSAGLVIKISVLTYRDGPVGGKEQRRAVAHPRDFSEGACRERSVGEPIVRVDS